MCERGKEREEEREREREKGETGRERVINKHRIIKEK
jgi:hypothetical protein